MAVVTLNWKVLRAEMAEMFLGTLADRVRSLISAFKMVYSVRRGQVKILREDARTVEGNGQSLRG